MVRRLPLFLIILISAYSFNSELRGKEDLKTLFNDGLKSLSVGDYIGAINIFSSIYSTAPESYYGELSYLYLGKAYALYFYSTGHRSGIRSAIAFLNKYFYEYKTPRFPLLQREFLGDCYYMIGWYEKAKAVYDALYKEKKSPKYLIKFALSSAVMDSMEGYTRVLRLKEEDIKDIKDLYYTVLGYFMFNIEEYKRAVEYLSIARSINPYLENDPAFLYRFGASYYRTGDIKKATLYLEIASKKDYYGEYTDKINMYLIFIYLDNKNYKDAFEKIRKYADDDILLSSKTAQTIFSSLWMYYDFLQTYKEFFKDYRSKLRDIVWLNIEEKRSILPLLGIYYLILKEKHIDEEDREVLKVKNVYREDIANKTKEIQLLHGIYESLSPRKDGLLIVDLYKTNRNNVKEIFWKEKQKEITVLALLNTGDEEVVSLSKELSNKYLRSYIEGIYAFIKGDRKKSLRLLKASIKGVDGTHKVKALFLVAYIGDDLRSYKAFLKEAEKVKGMNFMKEYALLRLGDKYFDMKKYKEAEKYYRKFIEHKGDNRDPYFWWAIFQMGRIGEIRKDKELLKWVVKKASETNNIWSEAIKALWG